MVKVAYHLLKSTVTWTVTQVQESPLWTISMRYIKVLMMSSLGQDLRKRRPTSSLIIVLSDGIGTPWDKSPQTSGFYNFLRAKFNLSFDDVIMGKIRSDDIRGIIKDFFVLPGKNFHRLKSSKDFSGSFW